MTTRRKRVAVLERDRRFDEEHRVDTAGTVSLDTLSIDSRHAQFGSRYEAISPDLLRVLLRQLPLDLRKYSFIDLGSGKGRALLVAAECPFIQVIGVEFSRELNDVAVGNIVSATNMQRQSGVVRSICMDATNYDLPSGNCLIFFYDPFEKVVMNSVVQNITESYVRSPRSIVVLLLGPQSLASAVETEGFSVLDFEFDLPKDVRPSSNHVLRCYSLGLSVPPGAEGTT
jgi:SAM-dependent methyltransferase